jgi:hypothetical protein
MSHVARTTCLRDNAAYASPTSFYHMVERLPDHQAVFAHYDCLTSSVEEVVQTLKSTAAESFGGKPYSIVAHSLGGIVGLLLATGGEPIEQIFTMSTPFGGSHTASFLNLMFFRAPLLSADMNPYGRTIQDVLSSEISIPMRSIVSAGGGSPLMYEPNDGIVTVASQTRLAGPEYFTVNYNHQEVVRAAPVIDLAREFLFENAVDCTDGSVGLVQSVES